ncbi:RNA 2',3'-cyclic phosphodiesterase [Alicyclobacillus cycloheptanicus]|uniref:RNA 2',3'-cyclic phosphodiesterase n=1 Tax=Alicyclobacillus cycloheptanicus TaxID=1457 RepID=A0ABT9XFE1_9BACL|nr:RNA 2',3'-cyclic phosphodiesterase [Alicyclobacillus cycloheptanicus]MDQ0188985.1 2'-5' RNA ligase [Alicyclobacillus cycloheptanicus]WDM01672.1 RNA 2',3'-cyclic phosphodiesterase [Alicyclobacillus cycloheptanicus]
MHEAQRGEVQRGEGRRLFFGIALPDTLKQSLGRMQQALQRSGVAAGNWSDPSLFHITVLFLGQRPEEERERLVEAGARAASLASPFELTLGTLGVFERNRILWMGLAENDGMASLRQLHAAVQRAVGALELRDWQLDTRRYQPHLTLARKLDVRTFQALDVPSDIEDAGRGGVRMFPVEQLCLFESTRMAGKLTYPVVKAFPLG